MGGTSEDKKSSSPPSWQQTFEEALPAQDGTVASNSSSRELLIQQAKKFLEKEEIQEAPKEKTIAFLETKELQGDEIENLLAASRVTESTSNTSQIPHIPQNTSTSSSPNIQTSQSSRPRTPSQNTSIPSNPPIITYPEFLLKPEHPSPLITKPRLLTALTLFSSLSVLLYGTHKHLVTPMLASLTASRLSLAGTASENLAKLIERLEGLVSELPVSTTTDLLAGIEGGERSGRNAQSEDSEDEDPTDLYHRDIGVQTSPFGSASPSTSTSSISPPATPIDSQTSSLQSLKRIIAELVEQNEDESKDTEVLEDVVGELREYCNKLAYTKTYGWDYGTVNGRSGGEREGEEEDEIARVKKSIRSVKGALLSTRTFPRAVAVGAGGAGGWGARRGGRTDTDE